MLEIMRPTKCYFEEFLFSFRAYELVVSDAASSPQTNYKNKGSDRQGGLMAVLCDEGRCPSPPLPVTL